MRLYYFVIGVVVSFLGFMLSDWAMKTSELGINGHFMEALFFFLWVFGLMFCAAGILWTVMAIFKEDLT